MSTALVTREGRWYHYRDGRRVRANGGRILTCCRCGDRFTHGVSRVLRFVLFHFCASCHVNCKNDCDRIMREVAA